jgi:hypothetical protein
MSRGKALPVEASTVRFPPDVRAVLRAHAYQRNVTVNKLINDILTCYLIYITDFNHPYFTPRALGFPPLTPPTDVVPGYLESLGFVAPREGDTSIPAPAKGYADHTDSTPMSAEDLAFLNFDEKESA